MMGLLAEDIVRDVDEGSRIDGGGDEEEHVVYVDVGVTTKPYFLDKAVAIEESGCYISEATGKGPEQVHLIGFDTLLRLLDPKYYPDRTLTPLEPFWDKCRVRVTKRIGDLWGGTDRQEAYVRALADGMREEEGGRREWAGRIELVEGTPEREGTVSSTKVREAVRQHDHDTFNKLVTEGVKRHILDNHLYVDEDA
jgi:nicotinamide-nucleotide adenylyltransferase